jgi:hypothetical protein
MLVPNKNDTWRMFVNFWALKKIMMKKCYPLPRIHDLLDQLRNATYFNKLDLRSGYHQIRNFEEEFGKMFSKQNKLDLNGWLCRLGFVMLPLLSCGL